MLKVLEAWQSSHLNVVVTPSTRTILVQVDTTMNGKKGSEAGIVIEKTEQAVIIAVFEGGIQGM